MRKPVIVTLTGPSCAGKSTLEGLLKGEGFVGLISTTTRKPREAEGEVNGKHYHFVDTAVFSRLSTQGAFVEEVSFGGNRYGLTVKELEQAFAAGKDVVLVCEPVGLAQIAAWAKKNDVRHLGVYVDNPPEVIAERFLKRAGIDIAEAMIHKHPDATAALVKTWARRMKEMLTTEQRWPEVAKGDLIEVYVPIFNRDNEDSAVRAIKMHLLGVKGAHPIQQVAA
jgi:guanylate kinase